MPNRSEGSGVMTDEERAREYLRLGPWRGAFANDFPDDVTLLCDLLADVRHHERELVAKARGGDVLQAAVERLPVPPEAAVNAVANAFRGSTTWLHLPDGRAVVVSPASVATPPEGVSDE